MGFSKSHFRGASRILELKFTYPKATPPINENTLTAPLTWGS